MFVVKTTRLGAVELRLLSGVVVDDVVAVSAGCMILGQPLLVRGVSTNQ